MSGLNPPPAAKDPWMFLCCFHFKPQSTSNSNAAAPFTHFKKCKAHQPWPLAPKPSMHYLVETFERSRIYGRHQREVAFLLLLPRPVAATAPICHLQVQPTGPRSLRNCSCSRHPDNLGTNGLKEENITWALAPLAARHCGCWLISGVAQLLSAPKS